MVSGKTTLNINGNKLVFLVTPWFTVSLSTVVPYISSAGMDTRRRSPERAAKTSSAFTAETSVPKRTLVIDLARLTPSTGGDSAKKTPSRSETTCVYELCDLFCKKFLGDTLFRFSLRENTEHDMSHFTSHSHYDPREFVLSFARATE